MIGTLTVISSNHKNVRTENTQGWFTAFPVVNEHFVLHAAPLDKTKDYRIICTTNITLISSILMVNDGPSEFEFETMNSKYRLSVENPAKAARLEWEKA